LLSIFIVDSKFVARVVWKTAVIIQESAALFFAGVEEIYPTFSWFSRQRHLYGKTSQSYNMIFEKPALGLHVPQSDASFRQKSCPSHFQKRRRFVVSSFPILKSNLLF